MDYTLLNKTLKQLISGHGSSAADITGDLANASALLFEYLKDINWAGFYLMDYEEAVPLLKVGPFQGKTACRQIPVGKGVCGTSVQKNETVVVPDVHEFPGHIACDSASASEIVIPIHRFGKVFGVLDIDSPVRDRFKPEDREGLEKSVRIIEERLHVISVKLMRQKDADTIAGGVPSKELMKRAGTGIFDAVGREKWKECEPVAIVCGKGNNAGDGYVVACLLKDAGIDCSIVRLTDDFSGDGSYYHEMALSRKVKSCLYTPGMLKDCGSILDCLLGTGFRGEVKGSLKTLIEEVNREGDRGAFVVSADINSGLNGDTGEGETFVRSDLTVSIGFYKTGHFMGLSDKAMKNKVNIDIGIR